MFNYEIDFDYFANDKSSLRIFGVDKNGCSIMAIVNNFYFYFYAQFYSENESLNH